jgi:hypothetical protein
MTRLGAPRLGPAELGAWHFGRKISNSPAKNVPKNKELWLRPDAIGAGRSSRDPTQEETVMRPILTTLTAAAAMVGVTATAPTPASANPVVIAPLAAAAILGGTGLAGVAVGSAAAHSAPAAVPVPVPAAPTAYDEYGGYGVAAPTEGCYLTRARIRGVWHRVQVCD